MVHDLACISTKPNVAENLEGPDMADDENDSENDDIVELAKRPAWVMSPCTSNLSLVIQ